MNYKKIFNKTFYVILFILFLTVLCGLIVAKIHSTDLENHYKEKLLLEAQLLSQIINPSVVKKAYYDGNAYQLIFNQINTFKKDASFVDAIYTVILTEQGFKFGPSTYKKEGSIPALALKAFKDKQILFDKNKTSVTAYVPVFDIETAKIVMILAFEVDAKKWRRNINSDFLKYFIFTVLCIFLLIGIIIFLAKSLFIVNYLSNFQINIKHFMPLIIGLCLGIIIWGFYNYYYEIQRLKWDVMLYKKNTLFKWDEYVKDQINIFKNETENILKNNETIKAFFNKDRKALNHKIQPVFSELKNKYFTTHLIFVEPNGKVFLRAHMPEKYGDKRITPILSEASYTGKNSWGVETGTLGGFLLSYARVLKDKGKTIGYIVIGIQIFELSKNFFRESDSELLTIAYKNLMNKEVFEKGKKNYGYTGQWDDYPDIVILNQTMESIPFKIQRMLRQRMFYEIEPFYFKKDASVYGCDAIPLLSKTGHIAGYLLVMKDFDFLWSVISNRNLLNLVFVLTLGCGNLFMLWILTGNANRKLDETFHILQEKERALEEEVVRSKELAIQAKSADFSKTQFLMSMSHEIRTPLNAIAGITHLLSKTSLNFQQQDYLKRINNASEALIEIINTILDFSKIEAGKLELDTKEFKLDDLIEKVTSIFVPKCNEKGIKFNLYISSDVPNRLIGDPLRLKQVLMNLLWNALKFTESGMIELSIKVMEWIKDNQLRLLFSVRDTGVGIAEEKKKEIFEPFTQLTYKEKGTGLGLALCKRLVEMMGGEITVESELGRGSDFKFTVLFEFVPAEPHILSMLQGKTALCVDDNPELLKILKENLESMGLSVTSESSGKEALKIAQKKFVDFFIVDWTTSDLTGKEVIDYIEKNIETKPCMIILIPYKDVSIVEKMNLRQIAKILIKPVVRSLLQDALLECLGLLKKEEKLPEDISFKKGKILVVEDDEINQIVIKKILQEAGFTVDIAENGKRAIQKLKENKFDAILMDIQMPEMDGIEATKLIREELKFETIPIIGLSAHAFKEEKQKALDAGMDDYLTKPVNPEDLFKTLSKWFKSEETTFKNLPSIIDMKTALSRLSGNEKLYLEILKKFYMEYKDKSEFIENLIAKKDFKEASMLIHKIKSIAGTIGAMRLSELSKELDRKLLQGELDIELFNEFKEELNRIISSIALLK
ncbi:response regulator [Thermodesulfovibrio yellowstonii]|uniref:response regulator n=1 Tax=Thermodesulfovibrio yellowstonii TaxID=28262 RepID=UPI003C7B30A0